MPTLTRTTKSIKGKDVSHNWHIIDAAGQILGRLAPQISILLQGKNKTNYMPNLDAGEFVVVINAKQVVVSGAKKYTKEYTYYSGYPNGLRKESFENVMSKNPAEVIRHAVSGMLPKNKLRDKRLSRLFVYPDNNHPYTDKITNK